MGGCNSCEPKKQQVVDNTSCKCSLDLTSIPTLNFGIYPDCLPPKDYVYIYRRPNNIFYYYDHYGVETELRGRPELEDLILQIEGETDSTYDGLTEVTYNVTREKLKVYSIKELDEFIQDIYTYIDNNKTIIEDNLTSTAVDHALSANMGRQLKVEVDGKQELLVSGVNLSTINGWDLLQGGNYNTPKVTVEDNLTSTSPDNALSANQGRRLREMIEAIEPSAFVQYRGDDIITSTLYYLDENLDMMYKGNVLNSVILAESNTKSTYATTYLLLSNTGLSDVNVTFPNDVSYIYFPTGLSTISIPAGTTTEIAVKGYGLFRIVTHINNSQEKDYYTKDEIDDKLFIINELIRNLSLERRFGVIMELDLMLVPVGEPMKMYYFTAKNVNTLQIKVNDESVTEWTNVPLNTNVAFTFDGTKDVLFKVVRTLTDTTSSVYVKSQTNQ